VGQNDGPVLSRLWTKVLEILGDYGEVLVVSNALPDCLRLVLFRRYLPLSLEVVENDQLYSFLAPIFSGRIIPTFYGRLLARFTFYRLVKFEFRLLTCACEASNEIECKIYGG